MTEPLVPESIENNDNKILDKKDTISLQEEKTQLIAELRDQADDKLFLVGGELFDGAIDLIQPIQNKNSGVLHETLGKIGPKIGIFILKSLGVQEGYEKLQNLEGEHEVVVNEKYPENK